MFRLQFQNKNRKYRLHVMKISSGETYSDHCKNVENTLIKKVSSVFLWQYDTPSHINFFHLPQSLNIDKFLYIYRKLILIFHYCILGI